MSSLEEKVETLKLADIENKEPNLAKDRDSVEDSLVACDDTGDNTLNKGEAVGVEAKKKNKKKRRRINLMQQILLHRLLLKKLKF